MFSIEKRTDNNGSPNFDSEENENDEIIQNVSTYLGAQQIANIQCKLEWINEPQELKCFFSQCTKWQASRPDILQT